jgi:hypothetical protein
VAHDKCAGTGKERVDVDAASNDGDPSSSDSPAAPAAQGLPPIPSLNAGPDGAIATLSQAPERLDALMADCQRHYGRLTLAIGDRLSRHWLARSGNPYRDEILAVAARVGVPGAVMLNLSYEWACSAGIAADPRGSGSRMLRTLDWPAHGLGRNLLVVRQRGAAGDYFTVTWPGFVGVLTAMAPGRFAAAINQPPLRRRTPFLWSDWLADRINLWQQPALPATHLLRRAFDTCHSYHEAVALLRDEPLCLPVFFSVSGAAADQGCVIERLENSAAVHAAPATITNHWLSLRQGDRDRDRGSDSVARLCALETILPQAGHDLSWAKPPILTRMTRLATLANAATGELLVQGWEENGPATALFDLANAAAA